MDHWWAPLYLATLPFLTLASCLASTGCSSTPSGLPLAAPLHSGSPAPRTLRRQPWKGPMSWPPLFRQQDPFLGVFPAPFPPLKSPFIIFKIYSYFTYVDFFAYYMLIASLALLECRCSLPTLIEAWWCSIGLRSIYWMKEPIVHSWKGPGPDAARTIEKWIKGSLCSLQTESTCLPASAPSTVHIIIILQT